MSRDERSGRMLGATFALLPILGVIAPLGIVPLSMAAAALVLCLGRPRELWSRLSPRAVGAIGITLLWILASCLWSPAPSKALVSAAQLVGECVAGLIVVAGVLSLGPSQRDRLGLALALGIAVALAVIGFEIATGAAIQSLLRRVPGQAPAVEAYNRGATTLAIFLWPAMAAIRHRWGKLPAGVGLVVAVAAIGILLSATAQLAVLVGAAAFLLTSWTPRLVKPALAAGALALAATPLIVLALPPVGQIASTGPAVSHSGLHRLVIWHFVAERIAERPLLGWGFGSSRAIERGHGEVAVQLARPDAQGRTELSFYEVLPLHPHNMSLQIWLETGLIGVVLIGTAAGIGLRPVLSRLAIAGVELAPIAAMIAASLVVGSLGYGIWQGWWICSLWLVAALVAMSTKPTAGIAAGPLRETAARAVVRP